MKNKKLNEFRNFVIDEIENRFGSVGRAAANPLRSSFANVQIWIESLQSQEDSLSLKHSPQMAHH